MGLWLLQGLKTLSYRRYMILLNYMTSTQALHCSNHFPIFPWSSLVVTVHTMYRSPGRVMFPKCSLLYDHIHCALFFISLNNPLRALLARLQWSIPLIGYEEMLWIWIWSSEGQSFDVSTNLKTDVLCKKALKIDALQHVAYGERTGTSIRGIASLRCST